VRRLAEADDRSRFSSGNIELDRFFARYAGQNQFRHHIGTTYVALDAEGTVVGYATVAAGELYPDVLPAKRARMPRYPLPVLRLARLAVDERARGAGAGAALLRAVFTIALQMSDDVGCVGVVVDAQADAIAFYERLGFVPLELRAGELGDRPIPKPMFLELAQIRGE
jgi:GNAT superfamily N-acetyltransferase